MEAMVDASAPNGDFMLRSALCENRPHWLELAVRPTATLGDLDRFLRMTAGAGMAPVTVCEFTGQHD